MIGQCALRAHTDAVITQLRAAATEVRGAIDQARRV
jgi:hypothetical protein